MPVMTKKRLGFGFLLLLSFFVSRELVNVYSQVDLRIIAVALPLTSCVIALAHVASRFEARTEKI
jgi:hypothetical protein